MTLVRGLSEACDHWQCILRVAIRCTRTADCRVPVPWYCGSAAEGSIGGSKHSSNTSQLAADTCVHTAPFAQSCVERWLLHVLPLALLLLFIGGVQCAQDIYMRKCKDAFQRQVQWQSLTQSCLLGDTLFLLDSMDPQSKQPVVTMHDYITQD